MAPLACHVPSKPHLSRQGCGAQVFTTRWSLCKKPLRAAALCTKQCLNRSTLPCISQAWCQAWHQLVPGIGLIGLVGCLASRAGSLCHHLYVCLLIAGLPTGLVQERERAGVRPWLQPEPDQCVEVPQHGQTCHPDWTHLPRAVPGCGT